MVRSTLTPQLVTGIADLFHRLGWSTTSEDGVPPFGSRFTRFCFLMERLTQEEQELVLTIAEDFLYCGLDRYPKYFERACASISTNDVGTGQMLVFLPLKNPRDREDAKSGDLMAQIAKAKSPNIRAFANKTVSSLVDITALNSGRWATRVNATIAFVDDYVGSGETAVAAINDFRRHYSKPDDTVLAISLVSLRTGHDAVVGTGVPLYCVEIRGKGISESVRLADPNASRLLMCAIENRIGVHAGFDLGYRQSEGLESMLRTPDNTLPLFWMTDPTTDCPWPAPFPESR